MERNTPTGVGKMKKSADDGKEAEKHPHGCGEDHFRTTRRTDTRETPPRVWGRFLLYGVMLLAGRNTPTGVGKINRTGIGTQPKEKHPHGCGEDSPASSRSSAFRETPPRVWGRYGAKAFKDEYVRNTPTGVGKIE